ncbi:MAG: methylenetetrahydrofolate reductase C-terminal domain-containing protein [Desulfobacterales bacterium]|nr:methylenetetrahydrofolate reductase C-terminal domain-containing protein [Desulfobacterales bacterium]
MIVGEQKPITEIIEIIAPYKQLLILGCGTCVKTCFAGGEDEVATLASMIRLAFKKDSKEIKIAEQTVERQCENEFIQEAAQNIAKNDAILSLACGAGVQAIAKRFPKVPVLPGINTTFIGIQEQHGIFTEECQGCGNCGLATFGAICPITRCSKKLLNGPCGGSQNGKCEVNANIECAWQLIIDRLTQLGQLSNLRTYIPPKNWRTSISGGPRKLIREDHII